MKFSKLLSILVVLLLSHDFAFASSSIQISAKYVHIDKSKRIILINQNINELNNGINGLVSEICVEEKFFLDEPIKRFHLGNKYSVHNTENKEYSLFVTELPIIEINTKNEIVNEPKVYAEFNMIEPNGKKTCSRMGIEIRGDLTLWFYKKSYKIEFWEDKNGEETKNESLLGLRTDDDWNLQAMYFEDLRIRSKTGFELWSLIDTLSYKKSEPEAKNGSDQVYAELFINNTYKGIYLVSEPVDKKQLKLEDDGELYKGANWGFATLYESVPEECDTCTRWGGFEIEYPDDSKDWEKVETFVDFIVNSSKTDFDKTYFTLFEKDNLVNYFIFLNVLCGEDNRGKNLFIAKYNRSGRYFYVPWDLDGTFGADWEGKLTMPIEKMISNNFFKRLLLDNSAYGFVNRLVNRWRELRRSVISADKLINMICKNYDILTTNNILEREALAYERYSSDTTRLDSIKMWITARIDFLDKEFDRLSQTIDTSIIIVPDGINIYPLPADEYITVSINNYYGDVSIELIDIMGRLAYSALSQNCSKFNVSSLAPGAYYLIMRYNDVVVKKMVIIQ